MPLPLLPMPDAVRAYLHGRGLTDEDIAFFRLGYCERANWGWIAIPVKRGDGTEFMKLRAVPANVGEECGLAVSAAPPNKYAYDPAGSGAELYGRGLLALPKVAEGKIVICEGEFDAMMLIKNNIPAVTSTSGVTTFKEEWCDLFPPNSHVVLAFDADAPGEKGRAKVRALFRERRPDCVLSHVRFDGIAQGKQGYDITDFFTGAGTEIQDPTSAFLALETPDAEEKKDGSADYPGGSADVRGAVGGQLAHQQSAPAKEKKDVGEKVFTFLTEKELAELTYNTISTFDTGRLCRYPIEQLNTTLQGIFPGETVVVMADSGAGKSDFLRLTAEAVVESGKKVLFYQLEMDQQENTRRKLLRHVNRARALRTSQGFDSPPLTPIDLAMGKIDAEDREVILEAIKTTKDGLTTYAGDSLTLVEFLESVRERVAAEEGLRPDLICLDHIHYFSREEGMPESESLSEASRKIRGFCRETGIPVLMAAHVRKRKRTEELTPDDIHGSGSILKEATTCIALTKRPGETKVAIWKSRIGGELLKFDQLYNVSLRFWEGAARNVMDVHQDDATSVAEALGGPVEHRTTEKTQRGFDI